MWPVRTARGSISCRISDRRTSYSFLKMSQTRAIVTQGVAFSLPVGWGEQPNADGAEYRSPDGAEQVLVSVLSFKQPQSVADIKQAIASQMLTRQDSVTKLSGGRAQLLPVKFEPPPGYGVTLVGSDVANGVLMCVRVVADSLKLATISYYRHRDVQDISGFMKAADPVCQSLRFATQ
jgi:hypothetical protein